MDQIGRVFHWDTNWCCETRMKQEVVPPGGEGKRPREIALTGEESKSGACSKSANLAERAGTMWVVVFAAYSLSDVRTFD